MTSFEMDAINCQLETIRYRGMQDVCVSATLCAIHESVELCLKILNLVQDFEELRLLKCPQLYVLN